MGLSILNNIPSLEAQNQLSITSTNLQNTLFQLSSGSKINSGADDPAGLSIADGLQANIQALTQSAQNVTDGVGLLQTADGALSQVTTLLNRAVTLATEAANSGLTSDQQTALQNEYSSITAEINQIGSNTTFNNTAVFSGNQMSVFLSDGSAADAADPNITVNMPTLSSSSLGLSSYATGTIDLTQNPNAGNTVQIGQEAYTFVTDGQANAKNDVALGSTVQATLQNLQNAVNGTGTASPGTYGVGTQVNQSAQIVSINGGSATVQALQAGEAGNGVQLTTNLTSAAGTTGADLGGGTNQVYNSATLTLNAQPGVTGTATGSITLNELPDLASSATGEINFGVSGTNTNPTAFTSASGTINLATQTPTTGNATGSWDVHNVAATDTLQVGATTYTFVTSLTGAAADSVLIGTDAQTMHNLEAAVNGTGTAGTNYSYGTATAGTAAASTDNGTNTVNFSSLAINGGAGQSTVTLQYTANAGTAAAATGVTNNKLTFSGTNSDTIDLGGTTYTFVAANAAQTGHNEIALGTNAGAYSATNTLTNLAAALTDAAGTAGAAGFYANGTGGGANTAVTLTNVNAGAATFVANVTGTGGNTTVFSATGANTQADIATTNAGFLGGGVNGDTLQVGQSTYTFVNAGEATGVNYVALTGLSGSTSALNVNATLVNLMNAVNGKASLEGLNTFGTGSTAAGNATMYVPADGATTSATITANTTGVGAGVVGNQTTATGNQVALVATGNGTDNFAKTVGPSGQLTGGTNADTVSLGGQTYTFVAAGQALNANDVAEGDSGNLTADIQTTLENLAGAVNGSYTTPSGTTLTAGTNTWASNSTATGTATISAIDNGVATVQASTAGAGAANAGAATATGNYVPLSANSTMGLVSTSAMNGGSTADNVTIGGVTYTFVAAGTQMTSGNQVALGTATTTDGVTTSALQNTLNNLMAAVNAQTASTGNQSNYFVTNLQGTSGATVTGDSNGVLQISAQSSAGIGLTTGFAGGEATATLGGLTSATLSGGATGVKATGMIDLTGGQPTVGNATGTLTLTSANDGDTVTVGTGGGTTYTFVNALTEHGGAADLVLIGSNGVTSALQNLEKAVNHTGVSGTNYTAGTAAATGAVISGINTANGTASFASTAINGAAGASTVGLAFSTALAGTTDGYVSGANLTFSGAKSDTATIGNVTYTFVAANAAGATGSGNYVALGTASGSGATAISAVEATLQNLEAATLAANDNTGTNGAATYQLAGNTATSIQSAGSGGGATINAVNGDQAVVQATTTGAGTAGAGGASGTGNYLTLSDTFANAANEAGSPGGYTAATNATGLFQLNANPSNGDNLTIGNTTYTFVTQAPTAADQVLIGNNPNGTLQNLEAAVNNGPTGTGAGSTYGAGTIANTLATISNVSGDQATIKATALGVGTAGTGGASGTGNYVTLSAELSNGAGGGAVGTVNSNLSGGGASVDLNSTGDAQTALTTIAAAIATVAAQRGAIGSGINQMNAAVNVMNNTTQNLTSSLSGIQDANIGQVVANMSKYQVLEQTGIAALAQANQQEQAVLKLLG